MIEQGVKDKAENLYAELQEQLQEHDLVQTLEYLVASSKPEQGYQSYHYVPRITQTLANLQPARNEAFSCLARGLLLCSIRNFSISNLPFQITSEVEALYQKSFARIVEASPPDSLTDTFYKDLALVRGALFPAGERVVEPFSGVQRSLFLNAGFNQGLRFIRAVAVAGGYRPVFRLHVHLEEQSRLSPETWQKTCGRLAEMLLVNPSIKGIVGASWYYDPEISNVSPRLGFINELLARNGAYWFFSHYEDSASGALATSTTRQAAFASGNYLPRNYVVFWPRSSVLSWYRKMKDKI